MVDIDASLGQQLLDIAIRQAVPQVPPHGTTITSGGKRYLANADDGNRSWERITAASLRRPGDTNATDPFRRVCWNCRVFEMPETRYARNGDVSLAYSAFASPPLGWALAPGPCPSDGRHPVQAPDGFLEQPRP